jgi:hypothetical protein
MTPIDHYVAPGAGHCRRYWFDGRVGAVVSIGLAGTLAVVIAVASGLKLGAIPFALAGVVFWLLFLRLGLWRFLVGLWIIIAGWLIWTIIVMAVTTVVNLGQGMPLPAALDAMRDLVQSRTPGGVMFQLITFAGIWPATWAALKLMHNQPFGTLFSPLGRIRWGDFGGGLALAGGFWLVTLAISVSLVGMPERTSLPMGTWLAALAPLAALVFLQASGEEIIFRGYVLQQLAARYRSLAVWGFLPAFLFGLAHYGNGAELGIGWQYVAVTTLFGLAAAALVWRTGSLAAAMGMHTGMNMFSLSSVGLQGIVEGTQLYLYDRSGADILFAADGAATLAILLFVLSPLCPFRSRVTTA